MVIPVSPRRRVPQPIGSAGNHWHEALNALLQSSHQQLPDQFSSHVPDVHFTSSSPTGDAVFFPCPLKEQEAVSAVKALEACAVAAIADLRYGSQRRSIEIDTDKAACFLMTAYITTVDGMDKANPAIKRKIPGKRHPGKLERRTSGLQRSSDTDLNQAQSILYRRLSANLYETSIPGEYYHIHGSLDASRTLNMIGLPAFDPALTGYRQCIDTIEHAVKQFTVPELEALNKAAQQAGVPVLNQQQFFATPHGRTLKGMSPFTVDVLEASTPRVPFPPAENTVYYSDQPPQCLQGIKVLELCRIIAGPTIGRSLAAHGATVLKITSPYLPDVPFFQLEVNAGKHTTGLDLRNPADRKHFDALLADADVLIDGYRPGALARLGYGPAQLAALARARRKGFVYVAEDCFGGAGRPEAEWAHRPGWQQIADCATGVAWEQGRFMGLDEPVVPPFPMSDYGTGALGCLAALTGLWHRATRGGSWACRTSLAQYDVFVLSLGAHTREVQERLRRLHDADFFALRHSDSVDEVGRCALRSMRRVYPRLFADEMMHTAWSRGFKAQVRWPREVISVGGLRVGYSRATRPNAFDAPTWDGWEVDEDVMAG
jgi:hypothetical protein